MKEDDKIDEIIKLFNRTELEEGEIIIDNSISTIAKKLDINYNNVNYFIQRYLNEKYHKNRKNKH